jgi:2-haloacid dehalogenase
MALTTIVFDIGGVLLDWDPRHLYRKIFADPVEMEWFLTEVCPPAWNLEQDRGRPWPEAEAEAIARHPNSAAQIRAFRARWPEMIAGPITGTVALLNDLHARGMPIYAITNFAADTLVVARQLYPFLNDFRGVIVSGSERMLKPDPRIFQLLAHRYQLDLTCSVFLDDNPVNCAAARNLGMTAIHFTSPAAARADLQRTGLL